MGQMRLSIGAVSIAALVGLPLIAVTATQFTSYLTTEEVLLGHARRIMSDVADETKRHVTSFLEPAEAAADLTERLAQHDVVTSDSPQDLERYFFEQLRSSPQFAGVYYGTAEGDFFYVKVDDAVPGADFKTKLIRSRDGERHVQLIWRDAAFAEVERRPDPVDPYDPRQRPWFSAALQAERLTWTDPYIFFSSQNPGITVASPVRAKDGTLRGVVGVDIEIADISTFLSGLKIGQHGRAFIMNHNGDVIAFPEPEKIKRPREAEDGSLRFTRIDELDAPISRAAFGALGVAPGDVTVGDLTFTTFTHEGEAHYAVFAPFASERWPWVIGLHVPENDYLGAIKANRRDNALIAGGIALLGCLIGFFIAHGIRRPMAALQRVASRIAAGNYAVETPPRSMFSEVRTTESAFHRMIGALRQREEQNALLTAELRGANQSLETRVCERTAALHAEVEKHRETTEALRKARDAAYAASDAKSAFLSNMSHELRTPLNVISGFAQVLHSRREKEANAREAEELKYIVDSAETLRVLIDDILDLAKIEAGKIDLTLEAVAACETFEQIVSQFRQEIDAKGLTVVCEQAEDTPIQLWVDKRRLQQVLLNLLTNAIKYNVEGGEIRLRTDLLDNGCARLSLLDSGRGIAPEFRDAVFEPFNRAGLENSAVPGTGIGLSFTKRLVELMGGEIGFDSRPGAGSTFWIVLPLAQSESVAARDETAQPSAGPPVIDDGTPRVLCIEDNPMNIRLIESIFASGHARILTANTGREGLEIAAREQLDLILLDINLPDMSGYQVLEQLRAADGPHPVPVVALTAKAMPHEVEEGLGRGFTRYLTKPIDVQELKSTVVSLAAAR